MLLALAAALALLPAADTLPRPSADEMSSAYLDADARETVARARERKAGVERSIVAYRTLARERISVGLRALRRDRVLFRRETAAHVYWTRDGEVKIEVLGARQVVPIALPHASIPDDLRSDPPDLAFDPIEDEILRGFGDDDFFIHPLASGSEAHYRFQAGDTTRLRLSPGRSLRLVELRVLPRREESRLLRGSFWLDAETHAPVRATLRLARPLDVERDLGEDGEDVPGILKPMRGELRYITIDYGYWEQRWWLPRLVALEVEAEAGAILTVPVTFERSYVDYEVAAEGDPAGYAAVFAPDSLRVGEEVVGEEEVCRHGVCRRYTVELPEDTTTLLTSDLLPPSIYSEGEALISESELRELGDVFGASVPGARAWRTPEVRWSYLRPDLLRYDRVEGLAIGARADADLGPLSADATLWLATSGPDLSVEVGATRGGFRARQRAAAYRRIAAVGPDPRALGLGSSLSALLLGRDDGDYYRAFGAEVVGEPAIRRRLDYRWRLFAERQESVEKATDFSLPRLFGSGREMRPNLAADAAEQLGASLEATYSRGLDPLGLRWSLGAALGAETGTYRLARPSASATLGFPLPFRLVGAFEAAGGTTLGEGPVQREWFLGGPATVRGYGGGSRLHGDTFWRGRAEVASAFPAARLVAFSDAGWAGERGELSAEPALLSAGMGASFLDGLLRLDLARTLRGDPVWRLDFHLDAPI